MEPATLAEQSDYVLVKRSVIEGMLAASNLPIATFANFNPKKFLEEFEQACRIDYRLQPSTIKERMRYIRRLLKFLDRHPLQTTRPKLRQFLTLNPTDGAVKAVRVLYGRFLSSNLASCFKVPQSPPRVVIAPTRSVLRETYDNLDDPELEAAFLLFASSGLRRHELIELIWGRIDMENRIVYPGRQLDTTKFQWVTCFNSEAKVALEKLGSVDSSVGEQSPETNL